MKKTSNTVAAFCLLNSVNVFALGLGEIQTNSALNQVLNAKIPLLSSKNEDPSNIKVNIASQEVFDKAGIDRPIYLDKLKFTPTLGKKGNIFLEVLSTSTIKEPFVNFILEVEWPQGRTLKEFTILLDPPVIMSDVRTTPIKLATTPDIKKIVTKKTNIPKVTAPTPSSDQPTAYGPISQFDTLWSITKKLNAPNGSSISHNQMMIALFESNPEAFYMNNINALKKGAILKVPSAKEIAQRSKSQANQEYRKQIALWSTSTKTSTSLVEKKTHEATTPSNSPAPKKIEGKLSLLTPEQKNDAQLPTSGENSSSAVSSATKDANIAMEMVVTLEEENKEVKSELSDIKAQLANTQRLLALKNQQLKQLQAAAIASKETGNVAEEKQKIVSPKEEKADVQNKVESSTDWTLYGGGLVAALLALFLFLRRKKEAPSTLNDFSVIDETKTTSEEPSDDAPKNSSKSIREETLLTELDSNAQTTGVTDPIDECDVYIAYGRYQQAEDVISKAVKSDPENLQYKIKLLDVFFASRNAEEFEELAGSLTELKESDIDAWNSIADMGEELCPESSLFLAPLLKEADLGAWSNPSSADEEPAPDSSFLPELSQEEPNSFSPEATQEDIALEETKLDTENTINFSSSAEETSQEEVALEETELDTGNTINFDSPITGPSTISETTEAVIEVSQETTDPASGDDFEFDFSLINNEPTAEPNSIDEEPQLKSEVEAFNEDSSKDHNKTKLSLAEAYIEMKDMESAREALDEILESGSEAEKEQAQDMLNKL